MDEKLQNWAKATGVFCYWFILTILALEWNGILGYMIVQGRFGEIATSAGFWIPYVAIMSALGVPIAYKGYQSVKGKPKT